MSESNYVRRITSWKLQAANIEIEGLYRAILCFLLNDKWVKQGIISLSCPERDDLWAQVEGESAPEPLCSRAKLIRKILRLARDANLEPRERGYLLSRIPSPPKGTTKRSRKRRHGKTE
jgi:hypothetical protein